MAKKNAKGAGTIRKKTVTRSGKQYSYWEARVTVGRDPGTGNQIQRSFTGKTQREVREKMAQAVAALDNGTYQPPSKITVSSWLSTWMDTYCTSLKPLTIQNYSRSINRHVIPVIGAMALQAVKGLHIQKVYNSMAEAGLSSGTIHVTSAVLHKAFSMAVKQGLIPANPCDGAEAPKLEQKPVKPLTDEEIPLFLNAIDGSALRNAYALCLFAGLREGECLGLSWREVDFRRKRITICQQLQQDADGSYCIAPTTKSGKPRTIEPPAIAFQYLQEERVRQLEHRLKAGALWDNPDGLVFTNELGNHLTISCFYQSFKRIAASIGRPDARPHDLRHTAATIAIVSGADIKSVQDMMGHATASFTLNVYAHTSEKMMRDTAARVQGYYDGIANL